jgi:hypothetical protein
MTLPAIRTMLIEKTKASRLPMHEFLPLHERKIQDQIATVQIKKEFYEKDRISKLERENGQPALPNIGSDGERSGSKRIDSLRERRAGEGSKHSVRGAGRPHRARARLIRYQGEASWSVDEIGKIDSFFRKRFGRPLPISALGQSHTHDRLGLDHSEAVDIAVRPDSAEGRGLMAYLRGAGIPFTAFRGKISRMSTGAHIHIGPPSPRLTVVKRRSEDFEGAEES